MGTKFMNYVTWDILFNTLGFVLELSGAINTILSLSYLPE